MSQIQAKGGQPQKQPKYAPIYTGRFFNGIVTNRSPLRAATASHIAESFYSDTSGDALIAGSNLEVSNRLTLVRRPGNPIYDTTHYSGASNGYGKPLCFSDFRVNKSAADVFGSTLESIFTMVDQSTTLQSLSSTLQRGGDSGYNYGLNFSKSSGAGQSFMQPVGNSLYFSNGVDNKKWQTSLLVRNSSGNNFFLQGSNGQAGTYPFGTYLIDSATGNLQQFIGINIGQVTAVAVSANELTLTVTFTQPGSTFGPTGSSVTIAEGTYFTLWGMTTNSFLNGATIEVSSAVTYTSSGYTAITVTAPFNHANQNTTDESGAGYLLQVGTTAPVIAQTGSSVPSYNTTVPASGNNFAGGLTLDGNTLWVNRGSQVENWGIAAPTTAPTFSVQGQEEAWAANTYYSPASIFVDPNGNIWQVTKAGTSGSTEPSWTSSPTHQQKVVINSVAISSNVGTFTTDTQSPALSAGDTLVVKGCLVATFLDGATLTVLSSSLSTTEFKADYTYTGTYSTTQDYGYAVKTGGTNPPSTITDGGVTWTCVQLAASTTWTTHTHYNYGDFIIATPAGSGSKPQVFQLGLPTVPFAVTTLSGSTPNFSYITEPYSFQDSHYQGQFPFFNSSDPNIYSAPPVPPDGFSWQGQSPTSVALTSLNISRSGSGSAPFYSNGVNGAGELSGTNTNMDIVNDPNNPSNGPVDWCAAITALVFIPAAGNYTFSLTHSDGAFFAFETSTGATKLTGAFSGPQSITAANGYGIAGGGSLCGTNQGQANSITDTATWSFPAAGVYGLEIDVAKWTRANGMVQFFCNTTANLPIGRDESGASTPIFPTFATTGASYNETTDQIEWAASVKDNLTNQVYTWNNIGYVTDFLWQKSTAYTLPGTTLIDTNGNQEAAYETGVSGATAPPWSTTAYTGITADVNPPLTYLNEGPVAAITVTGNTITATSAQGFLYWIALVNSLDNTVSNLSPVSAQTGPFVQGQVTFPAGAGLNLATIDPQSDFVAIFRTADGESTPILVPGFGNFAYTVPLTQYLANGYVDAVPDVELNTLLTGPNGLECTPPPAGTVNLTYHLNRIWYSVGNIVKWTEGPTAPIGNGNGTAPSNYAACPSQVKRLVPTAIGMLVLTQSDVYIIAGNGTSSSPILPAIPYLIGVGLPSYNALDVNGGLIGFFTTDNQFVVFDPSAGVNYVGFNIGDQFRLNNGKPGQSWTGSNVYVAWYVNGEDAGWYVADGSNGWYRMIYTPAPEQGSVTWSPFATIQGTCGAIASIETSPGIHQLLIGQTASSNGNILARNLNATTDNGLSTYGGTAYPAYGVIGSIVLANPGQIAKIAHITTLCVKTGSPCIIGVLMNEALPYYTGSFDILKRWVNDPPGLPPSRSFYRQRFYLAELEDVSAYCMDLQVLVQFPAEAAQNELQTLTIFGAYEVEQ